MPRVPFSPIFANPKVLPFVKSSQTLIHSVCHIEGAVAPSGGRIELDLVLDNHKVTPRKPLDLPLGKL